MFSRSLVIPFNSPTIKKYFSRSLLNGFQKKNELRKYEEIEKQQEEKTTPKISWYPGHIAKAEREIVNYIKKVDVVIELRDARIPLSTTHPMVPKWVEGKPLIVAIGRLDQISKSAIEDWKNYYHQNPPHPLRKDVRVVFVDGKHGTGVIQLKKIALRAGNSVNKRRIRKGILPRPVRAAIIGFPNVGKSALINRLLGRKIAVSRNTPGVTKRMQWVRLGGSVASSDSSSTPSPSIELLDSPGIIPAKHVDQEAAMKLAICNDIGEASYDKELVAIQLFDLLIAHYRIASEPLFLKHNTYRGPFRYVDMRQICERYRCKIYELSGADALHHLANSLYHGNLQAAADRVLTDFRKGYLGKCSLEAPPLPASVLQIFGPPTHTHNSSIPDILSNTKRATPLFHKPLERMIQSPQKLEIYEFHEKDGKGIDPNEEKHEIDDELSGEGKNSEENLFDGNKQPGEILNIGKGTYDGW